MSLIKKATRNKIPLKIGVSGPSGSGKTYSSLLLAKGMLGSLENVVILDTENGSANLYSQLGEYAVLPLSPPFEPKRFVKALSYIRDELPKTEMIIIDSSSHEWEGSGGCLDIHTNMTGNSFTNWNIVGKQHKEFVNAVLQSPIHIICTMRKKQDYSMNIVNGKTKVEKVGLKEVQRDGFEYDLSVNFEMDMNHTAIAGKDRTGMFSTEIPFKLDESTGIQIKEWNKDSKS